MANVDAKYLEGLLDRVRQHDGSRVNEIRSLKGEVEQLQNELAKKNQLIKQLKAQVAGLTDFKRSIVKSCNSTDDTTSMVPLEYDQPTSSHLSHHHSSGMGGDYQPGDYPPSAAERAVNGGSSSTGRGGGLGQGQDMEGQQFFVAAKQQLSYEQFQQFLQVIKQFNQHEKNKEQTLATAREVFGPQHEDLYGSFYRLLTRSPNAGLS